MKTLISFILIFSSLNALAKVEIYFNPVTGEKVKERVQ